MQKFPLKRGLSDAKSLHKEIEIKLLERERNGTIPAGDELKKFRTGELRSFIELCKSAQNQGSRRITMALSELNLKEN